MIKNEWMNEWIWLVNPVIDPKKIQEIYTAYTHDKQHTPGNIRGKFWVETSTNMASQTSYWIKWVAQNMQISQQWKHKMTWVGIGDEQRAGSLN